MNRISTIPYIRHGDLCSVTCRVCRGALRAQCCTSRRFTSFSALKEHSSPAFSHMRAKGLRSLFDLIIPNPASFHLSSFFSCSAAHFQRLFCMLYVSQFMLFRTICAADMTSATWRHHCPCHHLSNWTSHSSEKSKRTSVWTSSCFRRIYW